MKSHTALSSDSMSIPVFLGWPSKLRCIKGRYLLHALTARSLSNPITFWFLLILWQGKSKARASLAQIVKNPPAMWKTKVQSMCQEDPLEKEMATHSNILVWRIPWTEEQPIAHGAAESCTTSFFFGLPGSARGKEFTYQCRRCRRHGFHSWIGKIPWNRKWQLAPVFLPRKSHGQRRLLGYCPWGCKESNMTKHTCKKINK